MEIVKPNSIPLKGILIWSLTTLFFLYEFFLRTILGTFQSSFMTDIQISSLQFSIISSTLFVIVYGMMQIPVGFLISRIGLKKSLLLGSAMATIATIFFSQSSNFITCALSRVLMGFGASFGFICALTSVNEWIPKKHQALFIGLTQFIGSLGPMIAAGPMQTLFLTTSIHWRTTFIYLFLIGALLTTLICLFVEKSKDKSTSHTKYRTIKDSRYRLFKNFQPLYIGAVSATLYFTLEYLSENEALLFLELKQIPLFSSSYMISLSWLAFAIGSPLLGLVSDLLQKRKLILILCSMTSLLSILIILYMKITIFLYVGFALLGLSASGLSICFFLASEYSEKDCIPLALAFNNACLTIPALINAPLIGMILDYLKKGSTLTIENYLFAFCILILNSMISIFATLFLKEKPNRTEIKLS